MDSEYCWFISFHYDLFPSYTINNLQREAGLGFLREHWIIGPPFVDPKESGNN
jgi:hypothetical protein